MTTIFLIKNYLTGEVEAALGSDFQRALVLWREHPKAQVCQLIRREV